MTKQNIQTRLEEVSYRSLRKHWYNHIWGKLLIVLIIVMGAGIAIFAYFVGFYVEQLSSGKILSGTLALVEQGTRLDLLHNGNDPAIGPKDAPIVLVAFEDFECPFCFEAQPFIKKLLARYDGQLRFIYKDFPLTTIHPNAEEAAEAAQCANEQGKFWEYHDALFADPSLYSLAHYRALSRELGLNPTKFNECMSNHTYLEDIRLDINLGVTLGVEGTPTWFLNGEFIAAGYGPSLEDGIDQAIEYIKSL